jgi:hypothetical protein
MKQKGSRSLEIVEADKAFKAISKTTLSIKDILK